MSHLIVSVLSRLNRKSRLVGCLFVKFFFASLRFLSGFGLCLRRVAYQAVVIGGSRALLLLVTPVDKRHFIHCSLQQKQKMRGFSLIIMAGGGGGCG